MGTSAYTSISVITVCLNAKEFIEQTIRSVLGQTYPHMEYLIIDGGSSDGTLEIIKKYESHLAYWHSRPDRGAAHAFNLGLAQSRGDWILYLNADDFFLRPQVMEMMAPHLANYNKADVVCGQMIRINRQLHPQPMPLSKIMGRPWRWEEFRRVCTIMHPTSFTHRRYFDRVGCFNETFQIAMDYELFLRGGKTLQVQYIPIPLVGMRSGGLSGKSLTAAAREGCRAQRHARALPSWLAWLNFFYYISRSYLGLIAHKVLDPIAPKVNWPHRNSKTLQKEMQTINDWP
jgi:glycosyltransferase involved in cell wall biosynthesis